MYMVVREQRDLLIPGVAVLRRIHYIRARRKITRENIRIVSALAKQKRRTGSARQNAEMPESAEITDKTSEYFIRQRTKVTLEKRIRKKFRLSRIGYVNGTNKDSKIDAIDWDAKRAFLLFLIDSYCELSSFTLANLSIVTIKKKNTEERTT